MDCNNSCHCCLENKMKTHRGRTTPLWEFWKDAVYQKYKVYPPTGVKIRSQMSSLIQQIPLDEAKELITYYLNHTDPFYVRNKHPFGLLLNDHYKLRIEMKTGGQTKPLIEKDPTKDVQQIVSKIFEAMKKIGYNPYERGNATREKFKEYVGPIGWQIVEGSGGQSAICDMPTTQWTTLKAQMIKLGMTLV